MRKIAVVMAAIGLAVGVYYGIHNRTAKPARDTGSLASQAPALALVDLGGNQIDTSSYAGNVVLINFWATWCPPCVEETPSLSQFAAQFKDRGVVVLALSVDWNEKAYRAFLDKYKPAFLTARDFTVHADYGTFMYPETYIIDARGKVQMKIPEGADWNDPRLAQFVGSLL